MLGLITNDLIAKEALYHSSCYKLYTKVNQDNVNCIKTAQNKKAIINQLSLLHSKRL